jgi:hypothetical protein
MRVFCAGSVQFWGNTDPQNKVTNEFATPVLARSVRRTTLGVLGSRVLPRVPRGYSRFPSSRGPPRLYRRSERAGGGRKETTGRTLLGVLGRGWH